MADGQLDPHASTNRARDRRHDDASEYSVRTMSPSSAPFSAIRDRSKNPRKLILCFDGTGNKFHGDESDSNILKIFRMLDRSAGEQYHYYQPGIGTYVISDSLSHSGFRARIKSWYQKAKDSAVGSSFDQHVVGGYRFLMRFYQTGDEIYMFGFSRGAYIARFLAEMLDYIGLLCHGNEEMVKFAWKAFAQWQSRKPPPQASNDDDDSHEETEEEKETRRMYNYMKGFRETFSRPVGRIRFLGLFDTVNSVPRFETAWMQRSKFPYTARTSAKVIRHAVSIDERRAKFRQDLVYQKHPDGGGHHHQHHHHHSHHDIGDMIDRIRKSFDGTAEPSDTAQPPASADEKERRPSQFLAPDVAQAGRERGTSRSAGRFAPYRARSKSRQRTARGALAETDAMSCTSNEAEWGDNVDDWQNEDQDIDEVWFSGGHGDIGGGWEALDDRKSASHVPLSWMVREATKAGLAFDVDNVTEMGCHDAYGQQQVRSTARAPKAVRANNPEILVEDEAGHQLQTSQQTCLPSPDLDSNSSEKPGEQNLNTHRSPFHDLMHKAHTSRIHDSLMYGDGLGNIAVTAWKFMEYLPFRRMDLQGDGSWKPIRWPLPCGEVRDIPENVRVHGSVIRRMKEDSTYRPGNLIVGGGGRGVRRAPNEYGIGEWVCVAEPGDPVGEIWVRKADENKE